MDKRAAFCAGLGLGAGLMYMLDPDRGNRRRALVRDQAVRATRKTRDMAGKTARDLRNRATGIVAETKARLNETHVPDPVVVDRVRASLGRYPVHDRAIHVDASEGKVILTGDTLAEEVDTVLNAVSSVRGVKDVINNLTVHQSAEGISSLQGQPAGAYASRGQ